MVAGKHKAIHDERDRKVEEAREVRRTGSPSYDWIGQYDGLLVRRALDWIALTAQWYVVRYRRVSNGGGSLHSDQN
jgi:hypothetical protein